MAVWSSEKEVHSVWLGAEGSVKKWIRTTELPLTGIESTLDGRRPLACLQQCKGGDREKTFRRGCKDARKLRGMDHRRVENVCWRSSAMMLVLQAIRCSLIQRRCQSVE
eukprot:3521570-Amphidinium_carterae.1